MRRIFILCSLILFANAAAFSQTPSQDAQLTQALITEIRQLRQDLQTAGVTIQRVQIVMYRLQAEAQLVSRATQRLDEARSRCGILQSQQKMVASQLEQTETRLRASQNPNEQKNLEDAIARYKANLGVATSDEQQCHMREADADSAVRTEQAKMNDFQDQLDKLDKTLANIGK